MAKAHIGKNKHSWTYSIPVQVVPVRMSAAKKEPRLSNFEAISHHGTPTPKIKYVDIIIITR